MNAMRRRSLIGLSLVAVLFLAAPALALSPEDQALVNRAVAYLDDLSSVKASFTQTDERGDVAGGELYLARPARARLQYAPPSPLLITSDGKTVIVSNSRLKTFQRIPLSYTPLAVFLGEHISLNRGARVSRVDRTPNGFSVTARDARGLAHGELTLYFEEQPFRLIGWAILDAQGRLTRVALGPLTATPAPPADFFTQVPPARKSEATL
jgi:outer membrane lipoprotein-sorting protein